MPQELVDSVLKLIESVLPYEVGTQEFYTVLGACVCTWVFVARLFMGLLKSGKGFIAAFFALVVPLFFGLVAYGLADWQVVPIIDAEWAVRYVPISVFGLVTFLTVLITAKRIFALNGPVSIFIFVLASAGSVGAYFGAGIAIETLEKGGEQIKQREERTNSAIDSVL